MKLNVIALAFLYLIYSTKATRCGRTDAQTCVKEYTKTGKLCQNWSLQYPNTHGYSGADLVNHNRCRNPNNSTGGAWCYIADSEVVGAGYGQGYQWDYCYKINKYQIFDKCDFRGWVSFRKPTELELELHQPKKIGCFDYANAQPKLDRYSVLSFNRRFMLEWKDYFSEACTAETNGSGVVSKAISAKQIQTKNKKTIGYLMMSDQPAKVLAELKRMYFDAVKSEANLSAEKKQARSRDPDLSDARMCYYYAKNFYQDNFNLYSRKVYGVYEDNLPLSADC